MKLKNRRAIPKKGKRSAAAKAGPAVIERRILILAPTGNDAQLTADFLGKENLPTHICGTVGDLCREVRQGCGAILLAEETLGVDSISLLIEALAQQPTWSDIPITIITSGGEASQVQLRRLATFGPGGNVTLLERPLRPGTMVSTLEVALRARHRQYEARDLVQALRESGERLSNFYESSHDCIKELDLKGRILSMNQNGQEMMGGGGFECYHLKSWSKFWKGKHKQAALHALEEAKAGRVARFQATCNTIDGIPKWWDVVISPILGFAGKPERILAVSRDVTERKQHEAKLAELAAQKEAQARLFDATLSSMTDLAYTFDLEGNWIYANEPLLRLWGRTLPEIRGKSSLELDYPPELAARLKRQVKEVIATRKPFRGETYFTDAAGVEDYHEYIFSPVFAADGSVAAVCGTTRLTTARKRAEAVAESQRLVLQLMAEDMPLSQVLDALMRMAELQCANKTFASILLMDPDKIHLRHGAGSSLPAEFTKAIDGFAIGPNVGTCGASAFAKKPVYTEDIATDPNWASAKEIALAHGLRACWSFPIFSTRGEVLGTFAIYHQEARQPDDKDMRMVEMVTRTASIAIERKLSDTAVRESQRRYSQLVQSLPTAIYTTDAQGRISLYNEAAVALWGQTPEIGNDSWCDKCRIYSPDGQPLSIDQSPMTLTLKDGVSVRGEEIVIERADGTRRNVLPYPDPIVDASGRIVGTVNMLLDITERKLAEGASRQLAAIVESSDDAIISKDLNGIITSWNRSAERLFGYRAEEVIGQPVTILMPPEQAADEVKILDHIRRGVAMEHYETIRRGKSGKLIEVSLSISPIMGAGGKIVGASKIVRDITQQKQAERKLERAHNEAVAASHAKDEFLAALSHELRTPLNPVLLLASEAAEDSTLTADVRAQFATIRNNVELEARLIDDLLDITRITHGKLSLNLDEVDVAEVLREAIETVRADLNQKHLEIVETLQAKQTTMRGDAVRLQQVFWNVLKNAVKFTPVGGDIKVGTRTQAGQLIVTISDTGIGMTETELAQIFEAFTQGDHVGSGGAHRFGGLGLGLAISRKLMELHAGTIKATSAGRDKGSTFTLTLPLTPAGERKNHQNSDDGASPLANVAAKAKEIQILLVEDHEATRTALAHLLIRRSYQVKTAASVAEARGLALTGRFQLLISDIGLPDGTGFDLMNELKAANEDLQGIALTGYGMEDDIAKGLEAGFKVHLTKPVRVQSLEAALATVIAELDS